MNPAGERETLARIREVLAGKDRREPKAKRLAEAIHKSGGYRWAGIYEIAGG